MSHGSLQNKEQSPTYNHCCLQGSETYIFNCNRWLAKNEDDGAIVRELVAGKVVDETVRKDGTVKTKEKERKDTLVGELCFLLVSCTSCW